MNPWIPRNACAGLAVLAGFVLLSPPGSGQSLVTFQNQIVARTGDPVPGVPGASFGTSLGMDPPVVQDDGRVFFQSQFFGGGAVTGASDRALFYGDRGALVKVLRWGEAEPTGAIPGAVINQIVPSNYCLSANGRLLFGARVAGAGITFSNDSLLYAGTPGNLQLVAREGAQAADSPTGAVYAPNTTHFGLSPFKMITNALGHVAFSNQLTGTLTGSAMFAGPPGSLVRVLTTNEVVGTNLTVANFAETVQMNASGQVLLDQVGYQSVIINNQVIIGSENDLAAWVYTPGSGKQQILRKGDPSPIAGAKYAGPIHTGGGQRPTFNAAGQAFVCSKLANIGTSTAVTFGVNDVLLLLASAGGRTLVARMGDPAPGIPGATLRLSTNIEMLLNDSGVVSFCSQIAGPGVTSANDTGLWVGTPGNLALVAREGSAAPGLAGFTFGDMCGVKLLNGKSQLLFHNFLTGTPATFALWCWDPAAGLQIVTKSGDTVEVSPGTFQQIGIGTMQLPSNGDARPGAFADDGTLTRSTGLGVGSAGGIVKTRIGSLTGLPKTISAAGGGVHSLFLNATATHAGEAYLVAGSLSGTSPGFQAGPFLVPLNPDLYTNAILTFPNVPPFGNTLGTLSPVGLAVATITIPPGIPGLAGLVLHHAFGAVNGSGALAFVSEAAALTIVP